MAPVLGEANDVPDLAALLIYSALARRWREISGAVARPACPLKMAIFPFRRRVKQLQGENGVTGDLLDVFPLEI